MNSKPDTSGFIREDIENSDGYHSYKEIATNGYSRLGTVTRLGKRFFVKSIVPGFSDDAMLRRMLRKEFDILLDLTHQGIVQTIDFISIPDVGDAIIMKWVEGVTLDIFMEAKPDKKLRESIAIELIETLSWLHGKGIIHRDLKPSNIIVGNGHAKLIDFGLGDSNEYTAIKLPAGTEGWAAPEQLVNGYSAKTECDVYALGKLLAFLNPGFKFKHIIEKCTRLDPEKRYKDASCVLAALGKLRQSDKIARFSILSLFVILIFFLIYKGKEPEERTSTYIETQTSSTASQENYETENAVEKSDSVMPNIRIPREIPGEMSDIDEKVNESDFDHSADEAIDVMKTESDKLLLKAWKQKKELLKDSSTVYYTMREITDDLEQGDFFKAYQREYFNIYSRVREDFGDKMSEKEMNRFDFEVWDPVFLHWGAYYILLHGIDQMDKAEELIQKNIKNKDRFGTEIQKYDARRKLESLHIETDNYKKGILPAIEIE